MQKSAKKEAPISVLLFRGADNEIRTHDLVITNDVLCQLSYISITADVIIAEVSPFVNTIFEIYSFYLQKCVFSGRTRCGIGEGQVDSSSLRSSE